MTSSNIEWIHFKLQHIACHMCQVCHVCIGNLYQVFIFSFSHLHLFSITSVKRFCKSDIISQDTFLLLLAQYLLYKGFFLFFGLVSCLLNRKSRRDVICHNWCNPPPLPQIMYFFNPHCYTYELCICQNNYHAICCPAAHYWLLLTDPRGGKNNQKYISS